MTDAFAWSSNIVNGILRLNLQAVLLAVFVAIICLLCRRWLAPRWKSKLWMLVFLRLCLPVSAPFAFSLTNLIPSPDAGIVHPETLDVADATLPTGPSTVMPQPGVVPPVEPSHVERIVRPTTARWHWSIRDVLLLTWLGGTIILLGRLGWLRMLLDRQLSELAEIRVPAIIRLAVASAEAARLPRVPRLLWAPEGGSPAVLGWWRPVLLLPRNSATLEHERLRAILMHEFYHVKSGDTLLAWLPRMLCALFWFNPLLWWSGRRWHDEREMACDEWVLRQIGPDGKRSDLETLVAIATDSQQAASLVFTSSIVSSATLLERRILAMKRHRKPSWKSMAAGALAVLIAGVVGLTDPIRAGVTEPPEKAATDAAADNPQSAATDVDGKDAPAQARPKALHPNIIFARHVILWEGEQIVTAKQLKQRLAEMRAQQPVKPNVHFSLGFFVKNMNEAQSEEERNQALNKGLLDALELVGGQDEWNSLINIERRGSAAFDRIETADNLTPDPAGKLTGRVLLPGGTNPAVGAQVVILPVGEACDLRLRNGKLREPFEEIWYPTDDQGVFEAYPGTLQFDPVLLWGEGKYDTVILHEQGYLVINGQLASEHASYELLHWRTVTMTTPAWPEDIRGKIWIKPAGTRERFPEFEPAILRPNARVDVKLPLGKGRVACLSADGGDDTGYRHPITITADSPAGITLPDLPADRRP